MTNFILKLFGFSMESHEEKMDDFSRFFLDAKSHEKVKLIRKVMREATEEQEALLQRYKEKELAR